jgi:hypothetical protein
MGGRAPQVLDIRRWRRGLILDLGAGIGIGILGSGSGSSARRCYARTGSTSAISGLTGVAGARAEMEANVTDSMSGDNAAGLIGCGREMPRTRGDGTAMSRGEGYSIGAQAL